MLCPCVLFTRSLNTFIKATLDNVYLQMCNVENYGLIYILHSIYSMQYVFAGTLSHCEGSALVKLGSCIVLCGVKSVSVYTDPCDVM